MAAGGVRGGVAVIHRVDEREKLLRLCRYNQVDMALHVLILALHLGNRGTPFTSVSKQKGLNVYQIHESWQNLPWIN